MGKEDNQGKDKGESKMNKLILLFVLLFISACTSPVENKSVGGGLRCINGHLHYSVSGYDYFPLFDCNSDTPLLIRCNEVNGRIQYDREKVK